MIDQGLLDECREMAFEVAPELQPNPLYIVDGETTFDDLPEARGCLGWAFTMTGIEHIPFRERIDAWKGAGPIIALCEGAIRDAYGDDFDAGLREMTCHEIGHIVPEKPFVEIESLKDIDPEFVRSHQLTKLAVAATKTQYAQMHDHRFIRRVLHIWYRAILFGWSIPIYRLFGGDTETYCQPPHFLVALMPELVAMKSATFAEIEAAKPPLAFSELWEHSHGLHGTVTAKKETP